MMTDIRHYFKPVLGLPAWRVKLGVGSFVTFEFGRRKKVDGHIHGEWHLWIYLSNWALLHGERQLVDSDSDRRVISVALRRLEGVALTDVQLDPRDFRTTFVFGNFGLVVSAADYLDDPDKRDHYWLFFMPGEVLRVGPAGVSIEPAGIPARV
jgi:hypothetical protein